MVSFLRGTGPLFWLKMHEMLSLCTVYPVCSKICHYMDATFENIPQKSMLVTCFIPYSQQTFIFSFVVSLLFSVPCVFIRNKILRNTFPWAYLGIFFHNHKMLVKMACSHCFPSMNLHNSVSSPVSLFQCHDF